MTWLVLGILLWSAAHLLPSAGAPLRARAMDQLGEQPYKGLFSLTLVGAIVLMVVGWRSTPPVGLYVPPAWGSLVTNLLVFIGLLLFAASGFTTNIKRIVHHPQLTGLVLWSAAHLLSNGDRRSLVLFGGLALWAMLEILFINRRDGAWVKPERQPITAEWKPLVAAVVAFAAVYLAHPYIAGVPPTPRF